MSKSRHPRLKISLGTGIGHLLWDIQLLVGFNMKEQKCEEEPALKETLHTKFYFYANGVIVLVTSTYFWLSFPEMHELVLHLEKGEHKIHFKVL
jgi:hypothetical protein